MWKSGIQLEIKETKSTTLCVYVYLCTGYLRFHSSQWILSRNLWNNSTDQAGGAWLNCPQVGNWCGLRYPRVSQGIQTYVEDMTQGLLHTLLVNQLESGWMSSRALQTSLLTYSWATKPSCWHLAKEKLSSATDTGGRLDPECTWSYASSSVLVSAGIPSKMLRSGVWLHWETNFVLNFTLDSELGSGALAWVSSL